MKLIIFENEDNYYSFENNVRVYNAEKFLGMKRCPFTLDDESTGYELTFRFENDWNIRLNPNTDCMEPEGYRNGEEVVFIENEIPDELIDQMITDNENFRRLIMEKVTKHFFDFLTKNGYGSIFNIQDEIHRQAEIFKAEQKNRKENKK